MISSLMSLFWDLFESRNEKSEANKFGNVIQPSILCDNIDNETPVIFLLPPPELHLLIGPVNKMYAALESLWSDSRNWLKLCNVKNKDYHGGSFVGNESRKLLKSIDCLEALSPPSSCTKFINAFKLFNQVVSSCYGSELHPEFEYKIATFAKCYMKLVISVIPKIHTVIFHIIEFCKITGRGPGPWSEQTGESVHHDFEEIWKKYKVRILIARYMEKIY